MIHMAAAGSDEEYTRFDHFSPEFVKFIQGKMIEQCLVPGES
jgi:hypothetical protein